MAFGIITGRSIMTNRDGTKPRILLQVQLDESLDPIENDIRTVELVSQAGDDNNPAIGCRVFVTEADDSYKIAIAVTDDLLPEVNPGEREIYSTAGDPATVKMARIKLSNAGEVIINQGTDNAVSWTDLNTALQTLVTAINAAFATKLDGAGAAGALVLDLSLAKVLTVKLP